jgi:flagellar biosynthesis protein FlhF
MNPAATVEGKGSTMDTKTYRGRSLEEILPRIKEELGPDAVITRQRNGLTGGVGGFFQRECIEVDARRGERLFDAYDEEPAPDEGFVADDPPEDVATSEGLGSRAIQEMLAQASPFAEHLTLAEHNAPHTPEAPELDAAGAARARTSQTSPYAEPEQPAPSEPPRETPDPQPAAWPPQAESLMSSLAATGLDAELANRIVGDVAAHELPFASPRALKRLVRGALARAIPVAPGASGAARSLAFVGPGGAGKTLCTARVAGAYAGAGAVPVVCIALRPTDGGAELRALLEPHGVNVFVAANGAQARALAEPQRDGAIVVVDTPAVSATAGVGVDELAADLRAIELDEVHLALPATVSAPAARELLEALESLGTSRVALTHADESSHIGGLIGAVVTARTPISYVSSGDDVELANADLLAVKVVR